MKLFTDGAAPTIVLAAEGASTERMRELAASGVDVILCRASGGRIDLRDAMRKLGERELSSALLEGGGKLNGAMLEAGLVDKAVIFYAPKIIGGAGPGLFDFPGFERMRDAIRLEKVDIARYGDRKSTRLNSSHIQKSRMPSSA